MGLVVSFEGYGELPEEKVQYQEADFKEIARFCHLEPATAIPGANEKAIASLLSSSSAEPYWKLRYKGGCHDIFFLTTLDKTPGFISAVSGLKYPAGEYRSLYPAGSPGHQLPLRIQSVYRPGEAE